MHFCADDIFVALVFWVNGDCDVTKHSFGARGGNHNFANFIHQRIGDFPECPLLVFVIYLNVRIAGLVRGAVVYDALTSVNKAIVPQFFEGVVYGVDDFFVQRKREVFPASASAQRTELLLHIATLFIDKIPDLAV